MRTLKEIYAYRQQWAKNNREKVNIIRRRYVQKNKRKIQDHANVHRWKKRGIIKSDGSKFLAIDYDRLYQIQQGRCAICGIHQTEHSHKLALDHNHKSGIARGLLCTGCNVDLGVLEDSEFIHSALNYLTKRMD